MSTKLSEFTSQKKKKEDVEKLYGILSERARPDLLDLKNGVWERTILERYIDSGEQS